MPQAYGVGEIMVNLNRMEAHLSISNAIVRRMKPDSRSIHLTDKEIVLEKLGNLPQMMKAS